VSGVAVAKRVLKYDELHCDLDHQPIVGAQIQPGQLADSAEALAERVLVNKQSFRG